MFQLKTFLQNHSFSKNFLPRALLDLGSKKTWAFLTWSSYLIYLHVRHYHQNSARLQLGFLAFSFMVLWICWLGLNYLPSTQYSFHTYIE